MSDKRGGSYVQGRYEIFAAGEVLGQSFDARLSSDNEGVPDSLRMRLYRTDPEGRLLGPLKATHYAVGDVSLLSTGIVASSAPGRGAVLTNRPIERPDSFDRTTFRGDLPAGWDAELYRNGQLLAFTSPNGDGRYEFIDVPLQYGSNRFEIVLYGPQGQIRREIKQVQVGMDSIPPQQTWYWAGFAQENADLIEFGSRRRGAFRRGWRGTLGIERGLDTRTSVAAYAHSLMIEDVRRNYGEVALRRSIGPTLLEVAGSYSDDGGGAARASWLAAFGETYVRADAMRGWGGFVSDRFINNINGLYGISVDQSVKLGRTVLPLHFDVRHVERRSGIDSLEASARASAGFRALTFTGQLDWSRTKAPIGPDPPDNLTASLLANARIGRVRLRGEARFALSGDNDDTRIALIGEWAGKGDSEWRAEVGYDRGLNRARAGAGYTRRFNKLQLAGFGEVASDGSVAASLSLAFSFGPKPAGGSSGGWRLSSEKLASRGQVIADVWMDDNGDGVWQAGEAALPGVPLTAGNAYIDAATDKQGQATIDGLEPFRPVLIGIDAGSLPDPYVQPALPGVVVSPRAAGDARRAADGGGGRDRGDGAARWRQSDRGTEPGTGRRRRTRPRHDADRVRRIFPIRKRRLRTLYGAAGQGIGGGVAARRGLCGAGGARQGDAARPAGDGGADAAAPRCHGAERSRTCRWKQRARPARSARCDRYQSVNRFLEPVTAQEARSAPRAEERPMSAIRNEWRLPPIGHDAFALLAALAVAAITLMLHREAIAGLNLRDADDAMRLAQVRDLIAGQGWFDIRQYRVDPAAGGGLMHWSRFIDIQIAGLIASLRPLLGAEAAERWVIAVYPPLLLLPLFLLFGRIFDALGGQRLVVPGLLLAATGVTFLHYFAPLRIDHHNWQLLLSVAMLWLALGPPGFRRGLAAALVITVHSEISLEGLAYLAIFGGIFGFEWLRDPKAAPRLAGFAAGLLIFPLLWLAVFRGWQAMAAVYCDSFSLPYLAGVTATAAIVSAGLRAPAAWTAAWPRRLAGLMLAGGIGAAAFLSLGRSCFSGPFAELEPLVRTHWYVLVSEGRPLWELAPSFAAVSLAPTIVGLVAAIWAWRRARGGPFAANWTQATLACLGAALVSVMVMRTGAVAHAFLLPAFAVLALAIWDWSRARRTVLGRVGGAAAILLGLAVGRGGLAFLRGRAICAAAARRRYRRRGRGRERPCCRRWPRRRRPGCSRRSISARRCSSGRRTASLRRGIIAIMRQ